jgi:hypothetical protein
MFASPFFKQKESIFHNTIISDVNRKMQNGRKACFVFLAALVSSRDSLLSQRLYQEKENRQNERQSGGIAGNVGLA